MNKKYISVIYILFLLFFIQSCQFVANGDKVQKGSFRAVITETGELKAVNSKIVIMPSFDFSYGRPKIADIVKEGTIVKKGDYIGMIDTASVARELGTKKSELDILQAELNNLLVQHETTIKQLEADFKSAEASLRQAIIDTQRVRFESETAKEIARKKLKITQIEYEKIKQKIKLQQLLQKEELLIQKEKIKQVKAAIQKAERTIQNFSLVAPSDGLIVYYSDRRRGKVQIGDELWFGDPIIKLPDLSRMKVQTTINERDIKNTFMDQEVLVRLDSYPKQVFKGSVSFISKVCRPKERGSSIKVFDIEVMVTETSEIMRPGMTVSCDFIVSEIDDALFVRNDYVKEEEDGFYVYIVKGSSREKVKVTLGPRNSESVVIYGDIKAGDKIAVEEKEGEV
ncbi:efflux RND transporter periplasmic adaptor subunit [candidate division KSB1 bacterium]|nr:efflux RND transporter periplasmic adaptor subunit [candidate division KSB1 bacterium]